MNDNPYRATRSIGDSDTIEAEAATAQPAKKHFSRWLLLETVIVVAAGIVGACSVYVGARNHWPDFSVGSGWWGTHFLDSMLYSMGDPQVAKGIVAFLWFVYGGAIALGLITLIRLSFWLRRSLNRQPRE